MDYIRSNLTSRIQEVYGELANGTCSFGRPEFTYACTLLLGYAPVGSEVDEIFGRETDHLTCQDFEFIVRRKIQLVPLDRSILNAFMHMDADCKGYVTLRDFRREYDSLKLETQVRWPNVKEQFQQIATNATVDKASFHSIFRENGKRFEP